VKGERSLHGGADCESTAHVIASTRQWVEKAVIGLKLCPFAATPYATNRVRFCVSEARTQALLRQDLQRELLGLEKADPLECETTLLIHPWVLQDFFDYNEFLGECEDVLVECALADELQIASFHPQYQFAGIDADDLGNYTNRSPYPMLHVLRESSVTRAVDGFAGVHQIGSNNIETLRQLGHERWKQLWDIEK
jgi:uncharacterized protein